MAASFGVHFGATSACVAVTRDGKVDVVANDAGDRTTPAVVAYTNQDQSVGLAAKQGLIRNSSNTVCNVKQVLGRGFDDPQVETIANNSPVKIISKDGEPYYEVNYKERTMKYSPKHLATLIYKKMRETAESSGGAADSHDAVVTVPLYFTEQQRDAVSEAATAAGFRVLRLISEPSAAVLAYDLGQKDIQENMNVLVYRMGGMSLDCTIVHVNSGMFRVIASDTSSQLGGRLIDDFIVEYFADEFQKQWKCDCRDSKRSVAKLRTASESCKRILSTMTTAQCSVESLFEGIDYQGTLSRARFEGLCSGFLQRCLQPLDAVLQKAKMTKLNIDKVILCGGTGKIPSLQKQIASYFDQADVLSSIPPDEVIAIGAAKQASILSGHDETELEENSQDSHIPSLSTDILVQVSGDAPQYVTALAMYTPLPVRRQHKILLAAEQTSFTLQVFQRLDCDKEPTPIGKVVLRDLDGATHITAVFHARSDGSLHITCTEPVSSRSQDITVETS